MARDFVQIQWDARSEDACRRLVRLAVQEDLNRGIDLTSVALAPEGACGSAQLVLRSAGVVAGLIAIPVILDEMEVDIEWQAAAEDGADLAGGAALGRLAGGARDLLTAERTILNFLGRLTGVATLTRRYVAAVRGTSARIYDTRKTTPGWRLLEKYAVHCGGGCNHRQGLHDAVLIKDNHIALARTACPGRSLADLVVAAREKLHELTSDAADILVEIEVDTLAQLEDVLQATPDIVLLDNMTHDELQAAVATRNAHNSPVQLEASGGVTLGTVRSIAETGVDRISVGGLTHSAIAADIALDWD